MKYLSFPLCVALTISAAACGGLSDDARIADLSDDEVVDLCDGVTAESKECGNGLTVTSRTNAECEAAVKKTPDSCTATVGDWNTCDSADLCDKASDAACTRLASCATP